MEAHGKKGCGRLPPRARARPLLDALRCRMGSARGRDHGGKGLTRSEALYLVHGADKSVRRPILGRRTPPRPSVLEARTQRTLLGATKGRRVATVDSFKSLQKFWTGWRLPRHSCAVYPVALTATHSLAVALGLSGRQLCSDMTIFAPLSRPTRMSERWVACAGHRRWSGKTGRRRVPVCTLSPRQGRLGLMYLEWPHFRCVRTHDQNLATLVFQQEAEHSTANGQAQQPLEKYLRMCLFIITTEVSWHGPLGGQENTRNISRGLATAPSRGPTRARAAAQAASTVARSLRTGSRTPIRRRAHACPVCTD